jgi:hypothetical protein
VNVRATIASHDGKARVRSATGTIAGVRADPIVQFVVGAVAARI